MPAAYAPNSATLSVAVSQVQPAAQPETAHWLTPREVARELRCSASYVNGLCREGRLGYVSVGSRRRIGRAMLDAFIEKRIKKDA